MNLNAQPSPSVQALALDRGARDRERTAAQLQSEASVMRRAAKRLRKQIRATMQVEVAA